jgi:uncharacterized RDD family membrane protein YckC
MNDPLVTVMEIETPDQVKVTFEIAGLGRRALATAYDLWIQALLTLGIVLLGLVVVLSLGMGLSVLAGPIGAVLIAANFLVWWAYFIYCEMTMNGQTPGKRKLGLRAVRTNGAVVTFLHSAVRNLVRWIDWAPVFYGIGAVVALLTRRSQRLGDILAGTLVVCQEARALPPHVVVDPSVLPLSDELRSAIATRIGGLKQEEYEYALRLLARLPELGYANPYEAQALAMQTTSALLHRLSITPDRPVDYAYCFVLLQAVVSAYGRRSVGA